MSEIGYTTITDTSGMIRFDYDINLIHDIGDTIWLNYDGIKVKRFIIDYDGKCNYGNLYRISNEKFDCAVFIASALHSCRMVLTEKTNNIWGHSK